MDKYLSLRHQSVFTALLILSGFILLVLFLNSLLGLILLMYLAIILAEGIRPVVSGIANLGLPYSLAVLVVFVSLAAFLFGFGWLLLIPLTEQLQSFVNHLPEYTRQAQGVISREALFQDSQVLDTAKEQLGEISKTLASNAIIIPRYIISFFFNSIVVFFLAYFWLTGSKRFEAFFLSFVPPKHHTKIQEVAKEISLNIGSFVRGVLVMMLLIGVISGLGVWSLGVPYAFLLGIIAGLTEAIPIIGPFIGAVPAIILALFVSPTTALMVALFYLVVQQVEGNILVPTVMNRILKIEPMVILISVLIGTTLLGVAGAFIAVPSASIVQTILNKLVFPKLQKSH
ncbi:MAG: hypothetical protein A3F33_01175 [Candidatus Woykebacteria bacterium RIFCSPHIGHO2_12_FULL_43_10]|nr:MAG: hypothetical protein A3F33_01175 [Candidatus Woykebacteria bacterium RIFCSPHIGHO2_12_FULL_43_10]